MSAERLERMVKVAEERYMRGAGSQPGRCPHVSEMLSPVHSSVRCELPEGHGPIHRCSVEHAWRNDE